MAPTDLSDIRKGEVGQSKFDLTIWQWMTANFEKPPAVKCQAPWCQAIPVCEAVVPKMPGAPQCPQKSIAMPFLTQSP